MTKGIDKQRLEEAEEYEAPAPLPLRVPSREPEHFPVKALGKTLAGAVSAIVDKVRCPEPIAAQSVLSVASLAVQAHVNVVHPATLDERPTSLALVTVAASGERKSAADKIALEPVRLREAKLHEEHEADKVSFENERAAHEKAKSSILKKAAKLPKDEIAKQLAALGPPPTPPLVPLLTVPDPTIEGLHKLMAVGEPSMGLFSDEAGSFIGGYSMSDESRLRAGAGLSDLWDGKPVKRVRGGDGITLLRGRRLTVHLMIQPGVADQLLADPTLQQQGLTSRLLVCAPPSNVGRRYQRPLKRGTGPALKKYQTQMLALLRLTQPRKTPGNPELSPRSLPLSKQTQERWIRFADECEKKMGPDGEYKPIQSFANKLPEHVLRIAGVLQVFDKPRSELVTADALMRAIEIGRFFAAEAIRLADESIVSEEVRRAETLLAWLHENHRGGLVHLAQIYQYGPRSVRKAEVSRRTMVLLERHHLVKSVQGGAKIEGKRYGEVWEVPSDLT
jgi:hypothetical protein